MRYFFNGKLKRIQDTIQRGFTMAEMMVVTAIFVVLTGVIIFQYGNFNSSILVSNMAYEVAITARQAQVFGLGARGFQAGGSTSFDLPYGLFIDLTDNEGTEEGRTKKFTLFADQNEPTDAGYGQCNMAAGVGTCTCLAGDECVEQYTMQRNISISDIKVKALGSNLCEADTVDKLAVSFRRPNPEAIISWQTVGVTGYDFVQIEVSDDREIYKTYVLIRNTGQISVSKQDICDTLYNGGDSN